MVLACLRLQMTSRRLCFVLSAVSLLLLSVLCLVTKSSYGVSRTSYLNLKLPRRRHASTRQHRAGNIEGSPVKPYGYQMQQWLQDDEEQTENQYLEGDDFMEQQALIQRERQRALTEACSRHPELARQKLEGKMSRQLYALEKTRLLYCAIPKAGCTNWKKTLMVLEGNRQHLGTITGREAHKHNDLRNLSSMQPAEREHVLQTYPKFIYVRHPFIRLISAYRNKIARALSQQGEVFQRIARDIVRKYRKGALWTDPAAETSLNVTWDEWIRYLTDPSEVDRFNTHWKEFYKMCLPCAIRYDFIGNLETVSTDSKYMFDVLGLEGVSYPSPKGTTRSPGLYEEYFANVSRKDLQRLWDIYKLDFELFNFAKPDLRT